MNDPPDLSGGRGRGAFYSAIPVDGMASEQSEVRRRGASHTGANRNADVGISNDKTSEYLVHRKSKVS